LPIANGGPGATTQQAAINALAGSVQNSRFLAGDGTNVTMRAIAVVDVPTLNQDTTGTAANVTGTVAIANGGTGQITKAAGFNALSPITTTGDLILGNGANSATRLAIGANGYVLTSDGTTASWAAGGGGGGSVTISNDTATASNLYPAFFAATSGTASTAYTSNAKLLYKPSTGEFQSTILTGTVNAPNTFGFKNRIINGAMVIDQRNAGASVTQVTVDTYTVDRWVCAGGVTSKFTVQQNAGSVTPPAGYTKYLGVTSLSSYSVGASDFNYVMQGIEGFNVADLGFGSAAAATVALSFWVRSSLTGNFGGALRNKIAGADRGYPFTYAISAANTWEQKTIIIAGDVTGTWATNNSGSLAVCFGLGTGSTYSNTSGAWAAGNYIQSTSTVSVVGTNAATFYITGVQLEKSSTATSFDYRPYGTELSLCQRYFEKSFSINTAVANGVGQNTTDGCMDTLFNAYSTAEGFFGSVTFQVSKRNSPTITYYKAGDGATNGVWATFDSSWTSVTSMATTTVNTSGFLATGIRTGAFTAKSAYIGTGNWTASSEL
jgi:hypothetical protein